MQAEAIIRTERPMQAGAAIQTGMPMQAEAIILTGMPIRTEVLMLAEIPIKAERIAAMPLLQEVHLLSSRNRKESRDSSPSFSGRRTDDQEVHPLL
jgi:hypothetical protein